MTKLINGKGNYLVKVIYLREEMDEYCRKTLIILMCSRERELSFNELARKAKSLFDFSRPTLNSHLRHLTKDGFLIHRKEGKSNLLLKPSFYRLNYEVLYAQLARDVEPAIKELKESESLLKERNFEQIAWNLLRAVYFGDLVLTKLSLENYIKKDSESKRILYITQGILSSYLDTVHFTLNRIAEKAKEDEVKKVLREFDVQIGRIERFFKMGEFDSGEKERINQKLDRIAKERGIETYELVYGVIVPEWLDKQEEKKEGVKT